MSDWKMCDSKINQLILLISSKKTAKYEVNTCMLITDDLGEQRPLVNGVNYLPLYDYSNNSLSMLRVMVLYKFAMWKKNPWFTAEGFTHCRLQVVYNDGNLVKCSTKMFSIVKKLLKKTTTSNEYRRSVILWPIN